MERPRPGDVPPATATRTIGIYDTAGPLDLRIEEHRESVLCISGTLGPQPHPYREDLPAQLGLTSVLSKTTILFAKINISHIYPFTGKLDLPHVHLPDVYLPDAAHTS